MNAHVTVAAATHYHGSKGAIEIATMPLPYAANALGKLQRECRDGSRAAEIAALAAHVEKLQQEHAEEVSGEPAPTAREDANPRAVMGGNNPPEVTAYEAVRANIDDLIVEAKNWADGQKVENQAQADEVSRLIEDLRLAIAAADEARIAEKKPLDEKIAEIQTRYNALIADNKTTTGTAVRAMSALKATLKAFLDAEEAKRLQREEELRKEADKLRAEAAAALQAADITDLPAREVAEEVLSVAIQAETAARKIENTRVQARGGSRAMGLRKTFTARITNPRDALFHYWGREGAGKGREALIECLRQLAQQDVNAKIHTIPGVTVDEGTAL